MLVCVILDWLCVDTIWQHPTLVVVSTQPQLALLIREHGTVVHSKAPVGCHVLVPLKGSLVTGPAQLVLLLVHTLGGHLGLADSLVLDEVTLAAKGEGSCAFLFELEQAELVVALLVPRQPGAFAFLELLFEPRFDRVLELVMCKGEVHAVRVHLNEFEVSPVEVVVQELVVELKHVELGELVDNNTHLEGAVDCHLGFARIDLVDITDHLQVLEPCQAKLPVELSLILGVRHFVLPLHTLDELAVRAVAQELEHFGKYSFVLVRITRSPVVGYLIHKPAEDLLGFVVYSAIDSRDLETIVKVPLQEWGIDEHLLHRHHTQELLAGWVASSAAVSHVVFHVLRYTRVRHGLVNEERRELFKPLPQLPRDFDVNLRKPEPMTIS